MSIFRLWAMVGVVLWCILWPINGAWAQDTTPSGDTSATLAMQSADRATADSDTPVAVPEPSAKAVEHHNSGNLLWAIGEIWSFAVPLLILFTGLSAKLRTIAEKRKKHWYFATGIYITLYLLIVFAATLPLDWYIGFVRPHQYGLSDQSLGKWLTDTLIDLGLNIGLGWLFLWIPYRLIRRTPNRWWLYTGLGALPFILIGLLIKPVWIDPLFNTFGAMHDKQLESRILALADRAHIEGGHVYEVAKSVDTKTVNAYVTGLAGTTRIVLWDTAIRRLSEPQLLFVMGHEMGHYALGHVWKGTLLSSVLVLIVLYIVHRLGTLLILRYRERLQFERLDDLASLPLVLVLVSLVYFITTPFVMAVSRANEHEADRFGLEITRNNHAAASAFVVLQTENLSVPRPGLLYTLWRGSHPSLGDRIDFCNSYHPWRTGEPGRYDRLFTSQ